MRCNRIQKVDILKTLLKAFNQLNYCINEGNAFIITGMKRVSRLQLPLTYKTFIFDEVKRQGN